MLSGKKILVTGGSGYVGSEICRTAHRYGAKVFFSYCNNSKKAEELGKEISSTPFAMDMRNVKDITAKIDALVAVEGPMDILVNNASIARAMPLALLEEEDVDDAFDINLKGTLFVTRAVIKGMIRQKSGSIVNMGSIAGTRLLDVPVTYAMSKSAMNGMTVALAGELKKFHIRVNCVVPGMLEAGVASGIPEDLRKVFLSHVAVGRIGTARDVAEAICFLASDRASYINGQSLPVDGGI